MGACGVAYVNSSGFTYNKTTLGAIALMCAYNYLNINI